MDFRNNDVRSRFEAVIDDEVVGFVTYRMRGNTICFLHTIVPEEYSGLGIGKSLVEYALNTVRDAGWTVIPQCPFVSSYISEHPQYLDLVPEDVRRDYGL